MAVGHSESFRVVSVYRSTHTESLHGEGAADRPYKISIVGSKKRLSPNLAQESHSQCPCANFFVVYEINLFTSLP